jgi:hypothetical protein
MSGPHAMTGLFSGDYFIHRFDFDGHVFFAYGLLRSIDSEGRYHADYQCKEPPLKPTDVAKEDHRVVGRISKQAYMLARLRGWPNTESDVALLIDYSAGKSIALSVGERIRLLFVW